MKDQPYEFQSQFPLAETVERLRNRVRKDGFSSEHGKPAVGSVSPQSVHFYWYPSLSFVSSFKPIYRGHFDEIAGRAVLRGSFTRSGSGRRANIFGGYFFVVTGGFVVLSLLQVAVDSSESWWTKTLLLSSCFLSITAALCWRLWAKRTWRTETDALVGMIKEALSGQDVKE
jgi:hypothetical protein